MNRTWDGARFLALVALLGSACATSQPFVVAVPLPAERPATTIDQIRDYERAAATVSSVLGQTLGIVPFPVEIVFYPGARAFETGLLASGYEPAAARTASGLTGVGGYRRILINEEALEQQSWQSRVGILAHEMTHSLQYELGGGIRGASDQWLREGFAEWVTARVLERLRAFSYDDFRRRHLEMWRDSNRVKAPRLDDMASFPQWLAFASHDDIAPYSKAFLAVDLLVHRHGAEAIVEYFRQFAVAQDRLGNFRAAFGEDLDSFETALAERLN